MIPLISLGATGRGEGEMFKHNAANIEKKLDNIGQIKNIEKLKEFDL